MILRKKISSLPFTTRYRGLVFSGDAANLIDYRVLSRGGFEPGLTQLIVIWGKTLGDGIFLDVGANVGIHTLGAAEAYSMVFAIEPFPKLVERLTQAISINRMGNVKIIPTALANKTGSSYFRIPKASNLGMGSIVDAEAGEHAIKVSLTRGDDLFAVEDLPLRCAKIDTEGAEKQVLEGLSQTLSKDRPLVIFELLDKGANKANQLKHLFPDNYNFFALQNITSNKFHLISWKGEAGDIVAIPSERIGILLQFVK